MAKSNEVVWWSLFSAGGVVAALLVPALLFLTGIALPFLGPVAYETLKRLAAHPLSRLLLFAVIALSLLHWAHRFRHTLIDMGLRRGGGVIACLCYGTALVGTVVAAYLVITL